MRRRELTEFERAWLGSAPVTRIVGDRELDPLGELDVVVCYRVPVVDLVVFAVLLVPGWTASVGALGELAEARRLGLPVFGVRGDYEEQTLGEALAALARWSCEPPRPRDLVRYELVVEWRDRCVELERQLAEIVGALGSSGRAARTASPAPIATRAVFAPPSEQAHLLGLAPRVGGVCLCSGPVRARYHGRLAPLLPLLGLVAAAGGVSREAVWLGGVAVGDQVEPDGMRREAAEARGRAGAADRAALTRRGPRPY